MNYLELLFEPSDLVCVTDSIFGTQIMPLNKVTEGYLYKEILNTQDVSQQYFSINTSTRPIGQFFCINALNGPRSDANVSSFRNILLEFDQGTIEEQKTIIEESKLPYTLITFSGNKSLHVIISLETPLANKTEYALLVHRLYQKFPTCDKSTKNPSRLSRTPFAVRDNGVVQKVMSVNPRVPKEALEAFIGHTLVAITNQTDTPIRPKAKQRMRLSTMAFLRFGAPEGQWNIGLFKAAADLSRCGTPPDKIIEMLESVSGYLDNKDTQTIRSALKAVEAE